jgi:predicted RNase H-like HicB family nuclease/predicted transcriptional regulator
MQVVALIHEQNGVFGASFPDFLGCTTVANSLDAIIPKAAEALAFHVEGMAEDGLSLPPVRNLTQLRKDPIVREDSAGAIIALVPYAPPTRATRINITFDESLLDRVDRAAEAAGETRSGYLAAAARQRLASEADAGAKVQAGFEESARRYHVANSRPATKRARKQTAPTQSAKRDRARSRRTGRK